MVDTSCHRIRILSLRYFLLNYLTLSSMIIFIYFWEDVTDLILSSGYSKNLLLGHFGLNLEKIFVSCLGVV